jgi:hypothetical protein
MFFGDNTDKNVLKATNYRKVNTDCADVNLESSELSTGSFRALLRCFNANGALDPVDRLINGANGLTDIQLEPLVKTINYYILNDKRRLYDIEQTHNALLESGVLDQSIEKTGKILENDEFIAKGISLFFQGFMDKDAMDPGSALSLTSAALVPDPQLKESFRIISSKITPESWSRLIDLGLLISRNSVFQDLIASFQSPSSSPNQTIEAIVTQLYEYLHEDHEYQYRSDSDAPLNVSSLISSKDNEKRPFRSISEDLRDYFWAKPIPKKGGPSQPVASSRNPDPFALLDGIIGTENKKDSADNPVPDLAETLPKFDILLRQSLRSDSKSELGIYDSPGNESLLRKLSGAFGRLNGPIPCLNRSVSVPNGVRHILLELEAQGKDKAPQYVFQQAPLDLMGLAPFCELPTTLNDDFKNLVQFAEIGFLTGSSTEPESSISLLTNAVTVLKSERRDPESCFEHLREKADHPDGPDAENKGSHTKSSSSEKTAEYYPLISFLGNFLGDAGGKKGDSSEDKIKRGEGGFKRLIPLIVELADRKALMRSMLVLTSIDEPGRKLLVEVLRTITEVQPTLGNKTVFEVFLKAMIRHDKGLVVEFGNSLPYFTRLKRDFWPETLESIRRAFNVNNVHPFIDLIHKVMADSDKNDKFFGTLAIIAKKPEFRESIQLFSTMAQDGRLRTLLTGVVSLFHKFAAEGQHTVQLVGYQPMDRKPKHLLDLSIADSVKFKEYQYKVNKDGNTSDVLVECQKLSFDNVLGNPDHVDFNKKLDLYIACQNDPQIGSVLKYLVQLKLPREVGDGVYNSAVNYARSCMNLSLCEDESNKSFYGFLVDSIKDFNNVIYGFKKENFKLLTDKLTASMEGEDKKLFTVLEALSLFIEGPPVKGGQLVDLSTIATKNTERVHEVSLLPVLGPALDFLKRIIEKAGAQLEEVELWLATIFSQDSFPELVQDAHVLVGQLGQITDKVDQEKLNRKNDLKEGAQYSVFYKIFTPEKRKEIADAVIQYECDILKPTRDNNGKEIAGAEKENEVRIHKRVDEIIEEARNEITSSDVSLDPSGALVSRTGWDFSSLSDQIDPVVKRLSDKHNMSNADDWVVDAFLRYFQYFTKKDGETEAKSIHPRYEKTYLLEWLRNRAFDFKPIPLFIHGEVVVNGKKVYKIADRPKVYLYNTLKRLERVVYEVDFVMPVVGKNMGLDFLQEIADAWGDVDQSEWPHHIRKKYSSAFPHQNLQDAVHDIKDRSNPLENLGVLTSILGYPQMPGCFKATAEESWPTGGLGKWIPSIPAISYVTRGLDKEQFKARLFNIKQVVSVLDENSVPEAEGKPPGLAVLRDLFYELYYSSHSYVLNSRSPSTYVQKNNLDVVLRTIRLGLLSQMGNFVLHFDKNDEQIKAFVETVLDMANQERTRQIARMLFTSRQDPHLGLISPATSFWDLAKAFGLDSGADQRLSDFWERIQTVVQSEDYKKLNVKEALNPIWSFFEYRTPDYEDLLMSKRDINEQTAYKLRLFLKARLASHDLHTTLRYVLKDQESRKGFEEALITLSKKIGKKGDPADLKEFLTRIERALSAPAY